MKNLFCFLLTLVLAATVSAQKVYFIYFETDNSQPFFLKMDDKVYSSTQSGYFILSNLKDSTYSFSIGFPSKSTEAKFKLTVDGKDYGYQVKNFDFGLGLFDLQSLTIVKPQLDNWKSGVSYEYRSNDFASLLAKASNDTSLFYIPVVLKEETVVVQPETKVEEIISKPDSIRMDTVAISVSTISSLEEKKPLIENAVVVIADSSANVLMDSLSLKQPEVSVKDSVAPITPSVVSDSSMIKEPIPIDSTVVGYDSVIATKTELLNADSLNKPVVENYKKSTVKRHSESSTSEGFGLVFYDNYDERSDTIKLIIPNPKIVFKQADTTRFEEGFLEIKKDTAYKVTTVPAETTNVIPKPMCLSIASDNDFFKLRKNMAAKETDDEMISEAKKVFKNRCFSTGQIKNLGSLFLNDAGKYQFFDAAYKHVTDQEVFYALQAELKDDYYLKRFKALIGE